MKRSSRTNHLAAALLLLLPPAWAQQAPPATPPATTTAAAPAGKAFSQQDLDTILAPIALYPDALLAQMFMASTYPLEIVEAARWAKANSTLKDKALEDALTKQSWDPAVKSLLTVPQVLQQMNDKLDWTQKLGDAFLADSKAVMSTVQTLRKKAQDAGNLKTTEQQKVSTEQQAGTTIIKVESPQPEVVYVPTYNPAVVYGTWWYPTYPPYYMYPPGYAYAPGLAFATGVVVGAAIWGNCNWGGGDVDINVNKYNNFNKTNIGNNNNKFQHNSEHRKGVNYKDGATAQKYNRGGDAKAAQSREQFRGHADQSRSQMQSMDRSQLQSQVQSADRASGAADRGGSTDRGGGGGDRASAGQTRSGGGDFGGSSAGSRGSQGGFSGSGSGASTRAASSRGSASRGGGGGGGRGGGGRR